MADVVKVTAEQMRERARAAYSSDEIEIDDEAELSAPEPGSVGRPHGAFVAAWVWVPLEDNEELAE